MGFGPASYHCIPNGIGGQICWPSVDACVDYWCTWCSSEANCKCSGCFCFDDPEPDDCPVTPGCSPSCESCFYTQSSYNPPNRADLCALTDIPLSRIIYTGYTADKSGITLEALGHAPGTSEGFRFSTTYEFIPGEYSTWCPDFREVSFDMNCLCFDGPPGTPGFHDRTITAGITNYEKSFASPSIGKRLNSTTVPSDKFPACDGNGCDPDGLATYMHRNGISDNEISFGVSHRPWYTSISSYRGDVLAANKSGVWSSENYNILSMTRSPSMVAQGKTYAAHWNMSGGSASSGIDIVNKNIRPSPEYNAQHGSSLQMLSTDQYSKPFYIDGNASADPAEGDVFATVWNGVRSNPYRSFGFDYFSVVSGELQTATTKANYNDAPLGVFGVRPDMILFRIANKIYPNSFTVGYTGCNLASAGGMQGQTSCGSYLNFGEQRPFHCDVDNYMWTSVFYNQIAVGSRHAVVTMGEYDPTQPMEETGDWPVKTCPYLIQFSGQTYGQIKGLASVPGEWGNWSTKNINLRLNQNTEHKDISLITGIYSDLTVINNITYTKQTDSLYEIGLTGTDQSSNIVEIRVPDYDNNICAWTSGNVINGMMCDSSLNLGFTSCFKSTQIINGLTHPIWNSTSGTTAPYVTIVNAKSICKLKYHPSETVVAGSWDWVSAGNTGETCAICRCDIDNGIGKILPTRHAICWGGRFDDSVQSPDLLPANYSDGVTLDETFHPSWECYTGTPFYGPPIPIQNTFAVHYSPTQIDIKGGRPVIYLKSDPYALSGIAVPQAIKTIGGDDSGTYYWTEPFLSSHTLGKVLIYKEDAPNPAWTLLGGFGDVSRGPTFSVGRQDPHLDRLHFETGAQRMDNPGGIMDYKIHPLSGGGGPTEYAMISQRDLYGMRFTPSYPLISSDAWLNNRYKAYKSGAPETTMGCGCFGSGACCNTLDGAACIDNITKEDCEYSGGSSFPGSDCSNNNPCSSITGACCTLNIQTNKTSCSIVPQSSCSSVSIFETGVSDCVNAQCFKSGSCCDNATPSGCLTTKKQECSGSFVIGGFCLPDPCNSTTTTCGGAGNCCTLGTSGCSNAQCCNAVCAADVENCCTKWSDTCVGLAKSLCPTLCDPTGGGGGSGKNCCDYFTGPCCYPNQCVENKTPDKCIDQGGIFLGFNMTCDDCGNIL